MKMFGATNDAKNDKKTASGPPAGLTMLLRSFGLDPEAFFEECKALIGRGNEYAAAYEQRLAALEAEAKAAAEFRDELKNWMFGIDRNVSAMRVEIGIKAALEANAAEVTLIEPREGFNPSREEDTWPAAAVNPVPDLKL